jgi:hypothetical protein
MKLYPILYSSSVIDEKGKSEIVDLAALFEQGAA